MNTHAYLLTPLVTLSTMTDMWKAPLPRRRHVPEWALSDRLRKIRRDEHLTQEQMADALGVKTARYSAWEAGHNRPDDVVAVAAAIEREFGVPAAWTLGVLSYGRRSDDSEESHPVQRMSA